MSGNTQSEWRRGGDPANPPIDRVGVWERRDCASRVPFGDYLVTDLTSNARPMFREKSYATWEPSSNTVGGIQRHPSFEFRYIGPLPCTEQPASPAKGGREAFRKAMSDWLAGCEDVPNILDVDAERDTLSAALAEAKADTASAIDDLRRWSRETYEALDGQGEWMEADIVEFAGRVRAERDALKAEVDAYRKAYGCLSCDEQHDRGTMCPPHEVRSSDPHWKQRIAELRSQLQAAQERIAELEKAIESRCECRFEGGMLMDECHYHESIRCVCDGNGDPTGETWDHRANLLQVRLNEARTELATRQNVIDSLRSRLSAPAAETPLTLGPQQYIPEPPSASHDDEETAAGYVMGEFTTFLHTHGEAAAKNLVGALEILPRLKRALLLRESRQ